MDKPLLNKKNISLSLSSGTGVLVPDVLSVKKAWRVKEILFRYILLSSGILILLIISGIIISLFYNAFPAILKNGLHFVIGQEWNPQNNQYGAWSLIIGTLLTAFLALLISLSFSLSIGIVLGEFYKDGWFASFLKTMTELLAGIPSVIYGFWGAFFIIPLIQQVEIMLGLVPYGVGVFSAALVLAVMIIPFTASISRDVLELVPNDLKEAAYSLGATRFEVVTRISIPYSISGIVAGVILSLGRALGETMAVTMLIGNVIQIPENIFAPGQTIASLIANQFNEANSQLHVASMIELGLLLLLITAVVNYLGKLIIKRMSVE